MWSRFFFFQAEDGIRGTSVTGVQTCALPISLAATRRTPGTCRRVGGGLFHFYAAVPLGTRGKGDGAGQGLRSEERRVGKECTHRGGRCLYKNETGCSTSGRCSLSVHVTHRSG